MHNQPFCELTAHAFIEFMETIWSDKCEPNTNGGIIVYQHENYNRYHNAHHNIMRLREYGVIRSGGTNINGAPAQKWKFPDGTCVNVANDGSACIESPNFIKRLRLANV